MAKKKSNYYRYAGLVTLLALALMLFSAYLDLKATGLDCANWTACYGHLVTPKISLGVVDVVYQIFTIILQVSIFILMVWAIILGERVNLKRPLPITVSLLVIFNIIFERLTYTNQLMPLISAIDLLSSFLMIALLWLVTLRSGHFFESAGERALKKLPKWVSVGIILVFGEMALGAWTSANYAGLSCPKFPFCHGWSLHAWDLKHAFQAWWPFQYLSPSVKATIQMIHRLGAVILGSVLGYIGYYIMRYVSTGSVRNIGVFILSFFIAEVVLGILNVTLRVPVDISLAHNLCAILLLLAMVTLRHTLSVNVSRHKVH